MFGWCLILGVIQNVDSSSYVSKVRLDAVRSRRIGRVGVKSRVVVVVKYVRRAKYSHPCSIAAGLQPKTTERHLAVAT